MHIISSSALILAVATFAAAAGTPTMRRSLSLNPPKPEGTTPAYVYARAPAPAPITNAKRMAMGLPPLKPRHYGSGRAARQAVSAVPPVTQTCNLLATDASTGSTVGYLSPVWNSFGEYGIFQASATGALEVSFTYSGDSPTQLDLSATNGPETFTYVGAVVGFASSSNDLGVASPNYAYLGGTFQVAEGPAVDDGANAFTASTSVSKAYESAVWMYDPATGALSAQWINTDGSAPATSIVYVAGDEALVLTGDVAAFRSSFGVSYPEMTLTCVPTTSATRRRAAQLARKYM
ncbi:hypothetical protein FB451DRAFT_1409322 [Mycena latifolia]|nr:hypothetical protein FB451DRAFT_1409322 [Mycena latifolia]